MVQFSPSLDFCTPLQKLEVFRHALDSTEGADLHRMLWLRSPSSEVWLERRTAYTRSLGVMSIVGYVLGLGDRHPSNLMLDRGSGKLLHIDFGVRFLFHPQRSGGGAAVKLSPIYFELPPPHPLSQPQPQNGNTHTHTHTHVRNTHAGLF